MARHTEHGLEPIGVVVERLFTATGLRATEKMMNAGGGDPQHGDHRPGDGEPDEDGKEDHR